MKPRMWAVGLTLLASSVAVAPLALAQEPNPEQLKKLYEGAVAQLKAAQERKNQLAAENDKLAQEVQTLKKDLAASQAANEDLKRTDSEHADKSYFLRAHYMAWQHFIEQDAELRAKWRLYLQSDFLESPRSPIIPMDRDWPLGKAVATQPTSQPVLGEPSTIPSTLPATSQPAPATGPTTRPATAPAPAVSPTPDTRPTTRPA